MEIFSVVRYWVAFNSPVSIYFCWWHSISFLLPAVNFPHIWIINIILLQLNIKEYDIQLQINLYNCINSPYYFCFSVKFSTDSFWEWDCLCSYKLKVTLKNFKPVEVNGGHFSICNGSNCEERWAGIRWTEKNLGGRKAQKFRTGYIYIGSVSCYFSGKNMMQWKLNRICYVNLGIHISLFP